MFRERKIMTKELATVATILFTCESKQKISSVMQELKKMQKNLLIKRLNNLKFKNKNKTQE